MINNPVNIINFHSIKLNLPDDDLLSLGDFSNIVSKLKMIYSFKKVVDIHSNNLDKRNVVITFDDGYRDNYELVLSALKKHNVPATFYIASGFLDGGWMFNDGIIEAISKTKFHQLDLSLLGYGCYQLTNAENRMACISDLISNIKYLGPKMRLDIVSDLLEIANVPEPQHLMMTSEQVRLMHAAGMEIGGHTVNHPILTSVDKATARREIFENKEYLENLIGDELQSFAYPNGKFGKDFGPEHMALVKEAGYKFAVATDWGRVSKNCDPYNLPRFTPWDRNPWKFMLRLMIHRY